MNTAICTLFEGHYHHGVAALSNSLFNKGYRGDIYVGYRGNLPEWILKGKITELDKWEKVYVVDENIGIQLFFIEIQTNYNLANYKPNFMLDLINGPAKKIDSIFYFDTDIIVNQSWSCYEEWVNCGVALCEDVNSPLQKYHPRRVGWRKYFKNLNLNFKNDIYVNAGFIGLSKNNFSFLEIWFKVQEIMSPAIGGLENSIFSNQDYNSTVLKLKGFQFFDKPDQDALNAAIEVYDDVISYFGKNGMGFSGANFMMYHALGPYKPWNVSYLIRSLKGRSPRQLDFAYWKNTNYPFSVHSKFHIKKKIFSIYLAKFICRFYKV